MIDTERANNALLKALVPGGILHSYTARSPAEVLCVPQQSFLEAVGLAPYLLLPAAAAGATLRTADLDAPPVALTEEQHHRIAVVLQNQFLCYHLIHFDTVASTTFTTLCGHRGLFANTLDSVSRYGRIGASSVVCSMDPLVDREDETLDDDHPCKMHIYVIAKPLMDEDEMHNTLAALERAVFPSQVEAKIFPQEHEIKQQHHQQQQHIKRNPVEGTWYSREKISNYRQAVAADNDVGFDEFQRYMKMPVCAPLVQALSTFVEATQQSEAPLKNNRTVRRTIQHCMKHCGGISFFDSDVQKMRIAAEGFEKYIMTKIYWRAFDTDLEERRRGAELQEKLQKLTNVITADQVDALKEVESHVAWEQAMLELDAMNFFKSPRDKLRCAVRACLKLAEAVESALVSRGKNKNTSDDVASISKTSKVVFGADEFLPCFILLVLRAVPRNYYVNICYILKFRDAGISSPEENYCLATLESAAEFWMEYSSEPSLLNQSPTKTATAISNTKSASKMAPSIEEVFSLPVATEVGTGAGAKLEADIKEKEDHDELHQQAYALSDQSIASLEWSAHFNPPGNLPPLHVTGNERRVDVMRLLLKENKAFDDLTVGELRAIVEEARVLLLANQI